MDFNAALKELGGQLGLQELKLDENHCCTLSLDGELVITLEWDEAANEVVFHVPVGEAPETLDDCRQALSLSLLGAHTGGAALSLDDDAKELVLWKRVPGQFDSAQALGNALTAFFDAALYVRGKLAPDSSDPKGTGNEEPPQPPMEGPDTMSPAFWA